MRDEKQADASILRIFTRHFMREFNVPNASTINCGWCWLWALGAQRLVGGVLCQTVDRGAHGWLLHAGRHCDSDQPNGVSQPDRLPIIREYLNLGDYTGVGEIEYREHRTLRHFLLCFQRVSEYRWKSKRLALAVRATKLELQQQATWR